MSSATTFPPRTVNAPAEKGRPFLVATRRPAQRSGVRPQHDVRVEHRDEPLEVAVARGGHEGVDDLPLRAEIAVRCGGRTPHTAARAARQLPGRLR